ncbi:hypothetical protein GUA87_09450 [Sneathiella sp. P13V-1]|uniref:hypothetical protein n=1 Tax=Sneathiella sp. P13V-1 TaxID=2697366 RepID=UPI00187B5E01|nr:hypothetical protein [Sneathiella sp. P13V-1]MBE7637068.1 hypothetical protein [Sneathiella sp. P13V-1]
MTLLNLPQIAENQALAYVTSNDADGALEAALCDCKLDHDATAGDFLISETVFHKNWFHKIGGTPAAALTVTLPSIKRPFMMENSSGQDITLKIGDGIGTALPDGKTHFMYSDGVLIKRLSDATEAATSGTFSGALTALSATVTPSAGSLVTLSWGTASYDTDDYFDAAVHPTRLTVPAGVSKVVIRAQVRWSSGGSDLRQISLQKNGSTAFAGRPYDIRVTDNEDVNLISSAPLTVTAGDYFELIAIAPASGGADILQNDSTWFSIEAVG